MPYNNVLGIICKYLRNGKYIKPRPHENAGRKPILGPEIQEYLKEKDTLKAWANLTLEERTVKIKEKFGIKITDKGLRAYYKRLNIRFLRPQYRFYRPQTQQE